MMETLALLAILAPVVASALIWLTARAAVSLALAAMASTLVAALTTAALIGEGTIRSTLAQVGAFPLTLRITAESSVLSTVVAIVSAIVFVFALQYMKGKGRKTWFWGALSLFAAAMQLLVFAGDWLTFIVGWELMGFASFLLISTHFEEEQARDAAFKAFLLTRVTDLGLYVGIFALYADTGSLQMESGAAQLSALGAAGLIIAAMGKSAQVPFQSWLWGAMQGPTPVSALLHSATMVAAGALLLINAYPLFSDNALLWIGIAGGSTALLSGISAIAARDLKQLLASSTSSQLGLMFLSIAVGSPAAAFAHWIAHAFIKSGLFLGAGVFQESNGSTSFAKLSGIGRHARASYICFAILAFALAGTPPLVGYYSKDAILAASLASHWTYFAVAILGALLTVIYLTVALKKLFIKPEGPQSTSGFKVMKGSLAALAAGAIIGGFALEPIASAAGYDIPKDTTAKLAGIALLPIGGLLGWFIPNQLLPERLAAYSRNHYAVLGGYRTLIGKPIEQLVLAATKIERGISAAVAAAGTIVLRTSLLGSKIERGLRGATQQVGVGCVSLATLSQQHLEDLAIATIDGIATETRKLGRLGRRWQSGLVHKELMVTVAGSGTAIVFFLIIVYAL